MTDTIFISAGHSNSDPGACAHGRREADIAVDFRNMVAYYLDKANVEYLTDGTGTLNLPLRDAVKTAKDCFPAVEFHCNAGPASATGVEVLSGPQHASLAARLSKGISVDLGIRDRGAKPENSGQHHRLAFISDGKGLIVELFFITNKDDLAAYDDKKWVVARTVANILMTA